MRVHHYLEAATAVQGVEARDAPKCTILHRTVPTENYSDQMSVVQGLKPDMGTSHFIICERENKGHSSRRRQSDSFCTLSVSRASCVLCPHSGILSETCFAGVLESCRRGPWGKKELEVFPFLSRSGGSRRVGPFRDSGRDRTGGLSPGRRCVSWTRNSSGAFSDELTRRLLSGFLGHR